MASSITENCIGCTACAHVCPVTAITGERSKLHRIDPRRCIECEACGRVCPKTAVIGGTGKLVERLSRSKWKIPFFRLDTCISCAACSDKCPVSCIEMGKGSPGGSGSFPMLSGRERCVSCGYCAFFCPMSCITISKPETEAIP